MQEEKIRLLLNVREKHVEKMGKKPRLENSSRITRITTKARTLRLVLFDKVRESDLLSRSSNNRHGLPVHNYNSTKQASSQVIK